MAVLALYEEGGFEIAEDFRELPDHIAAELEFLYLLLFRESRGQGSDAAGEAGDPTRLRKRLLTEHLGRWAGPFTEAVQRPRAMRLLPRAGRADGPLRRRGSAARGGRLTEGTPGWRA